MRRMKRTRKTRIGASFAAPALAVLILFPEPGLARKSKGTAEPFAVIAGTVYRPPGFAIPGAEVTVSSEPEAENQKRAKKMKLLTDSRGEFSVRLPTVPMRYRVDVQMNGYQSQQKTVSVEGEVRHDLSFILEPESKSARGAK